MPDPILTISATYAGKPLGASNTFALDAGGELRLFAPGIDGFHYEVTDGQFRQHVGDARNDDGKGFNLGTFAKPGQYYVTVRDSVPKPLVGPRSAGFTLFLTDAVPTPPPAPVPVVVPPVKEQIANPTTTPLQRLTASVDFAGATIVPDRLDPYAPHLWITGRAVTVANVTLAPMPDAPKPYHQLGIYVQGDDATLQSIAQADGVGYPLKVNGARCRVRDYSIVGAFTDYAAYFEYATDIDVDGFRVKGGSTVESIVRFDEATGVFRNFDLDYTTATRKACIRGSFTGRIEHGRCKGAIVGVNPLGAGDGGQELGIAQFVESGTGRLVKPPSPVREACVAAVRSAIARGITDHATLCAASVAISGLNVDVAATVTRRRVQLAKKSEVDWLDVECLDGIRWEPGTIYRYVGGAIGPDVYGNNFVNVATAYPEPAWLLPGDVARSTAGVSFTGTDFRSPKPADAFLAESRRLGVAIENCTYNGKAVA